MEIISSLQEVLKNRKEVLFETKNGSSIHITPEDAYSLVIVHDSLNLNNQIKMRSLLEESGESFFKVLSFSYEQFNDKES